MKRFYIIFILIAIISSSVYNQDIKQKKYAVSFLPQYVLIGGIRLDGDFRFKETNNYFIVSTEGYSNKNDFFWGFNFEKMSGVGIKASYRYFLSGGSPYPEGVYLQGGATYNFWSIQSIDEGWVETSFGSSQAITLDEVRVVDRSHKFGFDFTLGYQFKFEDNMFMDFYAGYGYKTSIISKNSPNRYAISGGMLSPGYSGFVLLGGARIGVCF